MYAPCYADIVTTFDTIKYSLLWRIAFLVPLLLTGICTLGFIVALCGSKTGFKKLAIYLIISLGVLQLFGAILEVINLLKTAYHPSLLLYVYIPRFIFSLCSNALLFIYSYKQSRPLIANKLWLNAALITLSITILVFQAYFRYFAVVAPSQADQHFWLRTYQQIYLCCFIVIDGFYCLTFVYGIRRAQYINSSVGPAPLYVDKYVYRLCNSSSVRLLLATTLGVAQHMLLTVSAAPSLATLYVSVVIGQVRSMVYLLEIYATEMTNSGKTHIYDLWIRRSAVFDDQHHIKRRGTSAKGNIAKVSHQQSFASLEFSFEEREIELDQRSLLMMNTLRPPPRRPTIAALRNMAPSRQYSSAGSLIIRRDVPSPSTPDTFGRSSKMIGTVPSI